MMDKVKQYKFTTFFFVLQMILIAQSFSTVNISNILTTVLASVISFQMVFVWFNEKTKIDLIDTSNALEKIISITKEYGVSEKTDRLIEEELKKIFK